VRSDAPEVTLASNAFSGPVLPTAVTSVMGVGYFANITLDFAPRLAGMPVELRVAFVPMTTVQAGEHVTLSLLRFTGLRPSI